MYTQILRELIAAGLSGDALVSAFERIEASTKAKTSAERTEKWRANRVTSDVTSSPKRPRRTPSKVPPITPLNTPQGSEPSVRPAAPALEPEFEIFGEDPKAKLFRLGKTVLASFGVAEKRMGPLIGQWLKTRADPVGLLAAIQFARDQNVAEPVSYISTLINGKHNGNAKTNLVDLAGKLADELRRAEHAAGFGRKAHAL